ncbi:MAG: LamG-like jellyroll fold domain-containing protein [Bacteroidota bacterium]
MKKILLCIFIGLSFSIQAQVNLTNGLYAYYNFDNNTQDQSGNLNHALNHNALPTTDRCGNANGALLFNGQNDMYVAIPPALPDMERFSIHMWTYYADTTKTLRGIFSDADAVIYKDVFVNMTDSLVQITDDKVSGNFGIANAYPVTSMFKSWHQIVWVMDSTKSFIYIDTFLVATINNPGYNIGYHDTAYIGKMCDGNQSLRPFVGKLDEFRLYTRALNVAEVRALFLLNCSATGVNDLALEEEAVSVYPNPATNQLTINVPNLRGEQVNIYSVDGKLVSETKQALNNQIDISNLTSGVYIAEVRVNNTLQRVKWLKL